jgi:hypothetical protein
MKAQKLYDALESFKPHAKETVPDVVIEALQEYFFHSVTSMVEVAKDKKFGCPVQVYIACFAYNVDDTFKGPSQVTSLLACLQFLLRGTALYQANILAVPESDASVLK